MDLQEHIKAEESQLWEVAWVCHQLVFIHMNYTTSMM